MRKLQLSPEKLKLKEDLSKTPRFFSWEHHFQFFLLGPGSWLFILALIVLYVSFNMRVRDSAADLYAFRNSPTTGAVIAWTGYAGLEINERDVYAVEFNYQVDGITYTGQSFATRSLPAAGKVVSVEYNKYQPQISRMKGTKYSKWGMVAFIPFGIGMILFSITSYRWRTTARWWNLMKEGMITESVLESMQETGTEVNDKPVMKLTFCFEDQWGKIQQYVVKTTKYGDITDEETELILYNRENPKSAMLIDEFPLDLALNANGHFESPDSDNMVYMQIKGGIMVITLMLILSKLLF